MSRSEKRRTDGLRSYTSMRTYRLNNRRFNKTAEMTIRLNYAHPGRKAFEIVEESGPAILRHKVLKKMIESEVEASQDAIRGLNQITPVNYNFRYLRTDTNDGRPVFVLEISPKGKSSLLMRGEIWVDAEDLDITKITGKPAQNPSFWIQSSRFVYRFARVDDHWLPVATDSEAEARLFGHTEVTIRCRDYKINPEGPITSGK